ncbi:MAG: HAD hydrolase-like protein [Planctomycetaceae bacterium]|jgi:phosphoglycolate phosphatase|nr:HAD hydrolase-like protein [Planctomycetaceae bacterium]
MKYHHVLFDLDGTLTDPYWGITNSIKYALNKFNIAEQNDHKLKSFIGPPLEQSFMEYYHFNKNEAKKAIEFYREYYSVKGIYENKLYHGIDIVLKTLNSKNINCIVATSKLEKYAVKVLQHFNIDLYFSGVAGSNLEGTLVEKEDIIEYIIKKYKLEKEKTIMVGDRKYDIIGAKNNGINSIGVLYGYGTQKELEEIKPTYLCNNIDELLKLLLE